MTNLNHDLLIESNEFKLYIKFCKELYENILKKQIYFYDFYDEFNRNNNCDLFNLGSDIEREKSIPIVINYRNFPKNLYFSFFIELNIFVVAIANKVIK